MTNKRWFHLAVMILFSLVILTLLIQVSVIFSPVGALVNTIFIPLLFGGLLYYIASPFQTLLERNGLGRISGILIIILVFVLSIGVIGYFAVPLIVSESQNLILRWPHIERELDHLVGYLTSQREALPEFFVTFIDNLIMMVRDSLSEALSDIVGVVTNTIITLFMVLIIPLFFFFMLKDHEKFIPRVTSPFSGNLKSFMIELLVDIDEVLRAFIQGRIMASIIRALLLYIGFVFMDLDYAILLVQIALFLNIIPFIGPWITFMIVTIFTLVQSPMMMMWISVIFLVSYYIESRWVTPKIVTTQLTISPLVVITLIVTSAKFAGFWGLLLSLPLYAVLRAIAINIYKYRNDIKEVLLNDTIKR